MALLSPSYAAKNESCRKGIVATIGKRLFQRYDDEIKVVGEQMHSEEDGWDVGRQEDVEEVGERVIVVRNERERRDERMLP